jgi:hypothetical protein
MLIRPVNKHRVNFFKTSLISHVGNLADQMINVAEVTILHLPLKIQNSKFKNPMDLTLANE